MERRCQASEDCQEKIIGVCDLGYICRRHYLEEALRRYDEAEGEAAGG